MNNNKPDIKTYDDLLSEKQRLKTLFNDQKQSIRNDIISLKDNLDPAKALLKKIGTFTGPDKSLGLLNAGLTFGLDMLLKKVLLKKSGWIIRLAAPFFIRNALSHFAAKKIRTEMPGLQSIIDQAPKKVR
jgi:hypothetical protein